MKIKRLANSLVSIGRADKYVDDRTGNVYLNLTHGVKGSGTWRWYAGVSPKHFDTTTESLSFDGDNYNLAPIYKNSKVLKDKKDNVCYNIVIDNDPATKNDIILLWTIPSRIYKEVTYGMSGNVELVGEGVSGASRGDNTTTSPAPVLDIFGDCILWWSGINQDGVLVKQVITYDHFKEDWGIGSIANVDDGGDHNV